MDLATAEKNYQVAQIQSDPDAGSARQTALDAAQLAYDTGLGDAKLECTTSVSAGFACLCEAAPRE